MPTDEKQAIRILAKKDSIANDGLLHIKHFDQSECIKRAFGRLGLFWLLSLGSLPIMFVHWVLVPGFFIAGPIMAVITYRTKQINDHSSGECPACNNEIKIKFDAKETLPKWTYCPNCNDPLHLESCKKPSDLV